MDIDTGRSILKLDLGPKSIVAAAWSRDESEFSIALENGLLELRTLKGLVSRFPLQNSEVRSLDFSRSGALLAVGRVDGRMIVFDKNTTRTVANINAHNSEVTCLLFTQSDTRLISGGVDGFIHTWTIPQFRSVVALPFDEDGQFKGEASLFRLKASLDSQTLAAFTEEGRLRIWRSGRQKP